MIEIKCPKCGSTNFDCYDVSFGCDYKTVWALCYCENEDCDTQFDIKYDATEIELDD